MTLTQSRYVDRDEWITLAGRAETLAQALRVAATQAGNADAITYAEVVDAARRLCRHIEVILL